MSLIKSLLKLIAGKNILAGFEDPQLTVGFVPVPPNVRFNEFPQPIYDLILIVDPATILLAVLIRNPEVPSELGFDIKNGQQCPTIWVDVKEPGGKTPVVPAGIDRV